MAEQVPLKRYSYSARNIQGQLISGTISAENEVSAAKRLQTMGLAPLSLTPRAGFDRGAEKKQRTKRVKPKDLAMFGRQLATMISSGLPLIRALAALGSQTDHAEFRRVLPLVRADIENGQSFSQGLRKHKKAFPNLMVGLIESGEASGDLPGALAQLADTYEKEAKLRGKITSAMTYPIIVLILTFILVSVMLVFVVPRFTQTFEELGAELPLATRMLITISDAMIFILPIFIGSVLIGLRWYRSHKEDPGVRTFMDKLKTKTPVLGTFFRKVAIARFARTFAALMASGVPVLQALEIVSRTSTSMSVSVALDKVREDVRAGKPVNTTMMEFDIFPPLVTQMIATGEETGALPDMLDKIAEYYEREVDTGSESLGALIEPILLIFLSVIVGGMVLALYLPTFAIFETVSAG